MTASGKRSRRLHQGLSRLADQITATANNSAGQVGQLTANLEQLAGRVGQARAESEKPAKALEQRMDTPRVRWRSRPGSVRPSLDARPAVDRRSTMDARLSRSRRQPSSTPMRWITRWRRSRHPPTSAPPTRSKSQSRAAQHEEALHRLEDSIARLETRLPDTEFERRLDGIEHSVDGMAGRLEQHDPADRFGRTPCRPCPTAWMRWKRTSQRNG